MFGEIVTSLIISAFRAPAVATEMPQTEGLHPVAQRVTTQLGNPKALLYWTALFPQFIDRTHPLFAQFLILGILAICVETVVLIGYAFTAASVRRAVSRQPFMQQVLKGVTGCFFILIGLLLGRRTANV
jgi:threonine/homoserine/homoserine lactone efflux protein